MQVDGWVSKVSLRTCLAAPAHPYYYSRIRRSFQDLRVVPSRICRKLLSDGQSLDRPLGVQRGKYFRGKVGIGIDIDCDIICKLVGSTFKLGVMDGVGKTVCGVKACRRGVALLVCELEHTRESTRRKWCKTCAY